MGKTYINQNARYHDDTDYRVQRATHQGNRLSNGDC